MLLSLLVINSFIYITWNFRTSSPFGSILVISKTIFLKTNKYSLVQWIRIRPPMQGIIAVKEDIKMTISSSSSSSKTTLNSSHGVHILLYVSLPIVKNYCTAVASIYLSQKLIEKFSIKMVYIKLSSFTHPNLKHLQTSRLNTLSLTPCLFKHL